MIYKYHVFKIYSMLPATCMFSRSTFFSIQNLVARHKAHLYSLRQPQSTEGKLFLTSRRSYTPLILRFLRPPPSQKHNALLPMPPNPLSHLFLHLLPRISSLLFSHLDRYFTLAPLPHAPTPLCHLGNKYSQLSFRPSSLSLPSSIASLTNTPMFGRPSLSRSSPVLALANV
jgi:hypothetical protein